MKKCDKVSEFVDRWIIRGTLTTLGPLHVGDGGQLEMTQRRRPADQTKKGDDAEHDASTVCTDYLRRACIPASAIKGALRARVKEAHQGALPAEWVTLLGSENATDPSSEGGKVEFSDALLPESPLSPTFAGRQYAGTETRTVEPGWEISGEPPYWSPDRFTGVAVSVSLDRRTRTAKEKLLYHLEYVPAKVVFHFELAGDNLHEDDVARLLALLDSFGDKIRDASGGECEHPDPLTLGAQASNAWGRLQWTLLEVGRFSAKNLADKLSSWLDGASEPEPGYTLCRRIEAEQLAAIERRKSPLARPDSRLTIRLRLRFPGPLLVRDPEQSARGRRARDSHVAQDRKPPDGTPVLDEWGYPVIPAKTVRGVLRARAEMILRTLGHEIPEPSAIPPVRDLDGVKALDPVSKIFGASGWRAPFETTAFRFVRKDGNPPHYLWQEFVAIDRFTGGGVEQRKFNARSLVGATFDGSLHLAPKRLEDCGADVYALGLLALVLRDLSEGDMPFGSKAAIGYGACEAAFLQDDRELTFTEWMRQLPAPEKVNALRALPRWRNEAGPNRGRAATSTHQTHHA